MAKPNQTAPAKPDANDPFAGIPADKVDAIKSYVDSLISGERKAMDALIAEAQAGAASAPVSVTAAAGLDIEDATPDSLMSAIAAMYSGASEFIAAIERQARAAAQSNDHGRHTDYSRLATVFGEFRNGLATIVPVSALKS